MATLLVVAAEPSIRPLLASALRPAPSVIPDASGLAALAIFEAYRDRIDLIVTDVTLPGMAGLELVARLEELHKRRFPVLFITGASEYPIDADRAVLPKPFSPTGLKDTVRQLLQACRG